MAFADLREAARLLLAAEAAMLGNARALMHWRTRKRFCGVGGAACKPRSAGHVLQRPGCGASHLLPHCGDMLVTRRAGGEERALLAHNRRFAVAHMFSTLAGFVDPEETLEETVAREVAGGR